MQSQPLHFPDKQTIVNALKADSTISSKLKGLNVSPMLRNQILQVGHAFKGGTFKDEASITKLLKKALINCQLITTLTNASPNNDPGKSDINAVHVNLFLPALMDIGRSTEHKPTADMRQSNK